MLDQRGVNLSFGQRQLISFARALAADAKILVLDEATASVDSYTELEIQRALNRLLEGRTALVIVGIAILFVLGLSIVLGSWYTIDQRERGVILRNGKLIGTATPGLGFKIPFIDSIVKEYRTQMDGLHTEFRSAYNPRYQALIQETREVIKTVFSEEQAAEYQALLADFDRRRAERNEKDDRD